MKPMSFKTLGWASFLVWLLFDFAFANSRGGLLFKMIAVNIEIDDYKTKRRTTAQGFRTRNMLRCQIILNTNTNLIIYYLNPWASFEDYFANSSGAHWVPFRGLAVSPKHLLGGMFCLNK